MNPSATPKQYRFEVTDGDDRFAYVTATSAEAAVAQVAASACIDPELLTAKYTRA